MAERQQKQRKKGSWRRLLVRLSALTAAAYLLATFINGQVQVAAKEKELAQLKIQVQQQTEENKELTALLEAGDQDAYIERVAREKLGYARPGERVFVDIGGE